MWHYLGYRIDATAANAGRRRGRFALAQPGALGQGPQPKELFHIKGAGHMDLYDGNGAATAVNKRAPFCNLKTATKSPPR
jgi:hypothetical protein